MTPSPLEIPTAASSEQRVRTGEASSSPGKRAAIILQKQVGSPNRILSIFATQLSGSEAVSRDLAPADRNLPKEERNDGHVIKGKNNIISREPQLPGRPDLVQIGPRGNPGSESTAANAVIEGKYRVVKIETKPTAPQVELTTHHTAEALKAKNTGNSREVLKEWSSTTHPSEIPEFTQGPASHPEIKVISRDKPRDNPDVKPAAKVVEEAPQSPPDVRSKESQTTSAETQEDLDDAALGASLLKGIKENHGDTNGATRWGVAASRMGEAAASGSVQPGREGEVILSAMQAGRAATEAHTPTPKDSAQPVAAQSEQVVDDLAARSISEVVAAQAAAAQEKAPATVNRSEPAAVAGKTEQQPQAVVEAPVAQAGNEKSEPPTPVDQGDRIRVEKATDGSDVVETVPAETPAPIPSEGILTSSPAQTNSEAAPTETDNQKADRFAKEAIERAERTAAAALAAAAVATDKAATDVNTAAQPAPVGDGSGTPAGETASTVVKSDEHAPETTQPEVFVAVENPMADRLTQDPEYIKLRAQIDTAHEIKVFGPDGITGTNLATYMLKVNTDEAFNFSADREAEKEFRKMFPDKARTYDEQERVRVHRGAKGEIDINQDPLFLKILEPDTHSVVVTREEGMRQFALMYPEKAKGYAEKYPELRKYIKQPDSTPLVAVAPEVVPATGIADTGVSVATIRTSAASEKNISSPTSASPAVTESQGLVENAQKGAEARAIMQDEAAIREHGKRNSIPIETTEARIYAMRMKRDAARTPSPAVTESQQLVKNAAEGAKAHVAALATAEAAKKAAEAQLASVEATVQTTPSAEKIANKTIFIATEAWAQVLAENQKIARDAARALLSQIASGFGVDAAAAAAKPKSNETEDSFRGRAEHARKVVAAAIKIRDSLTRDNTLLEHNTKAPPEQRLLAYDIDLAGVKNNLAEAEAKLASLEPTSAEHRLASDRVEQLKNSQKFLQEERGKIGTPEQQKVNYAAAEVMKLMGKEPPLTPEQKQAIVDSPLQFIEDQIKNPEIGLTKLLANSELGPKEQKQLVDLASAQTADKIVRKEEIKAKAGEVGAMTLLSFLIMMYASKKKGMAGANSS